MSTPEQKLKRFLHYGREIPMYQPGDRLLGNEYHPNQLMGLEDLIANGKSAEAAACIVKAFSDGYSAHPEMLVYALAICAKQKLSPKLRTAAYKAVRTVCTTPENLFLFIRYASKLKPKSSVWGNGFRKVVKEWYLNKDPKTLAELVSGRKSYHGWSHKDVIKLAHLKADDPAKAAVIKYVLFGIATAKKEFEAVQGTSEVLNYIQTVELFKRTKDQQEAAMIVESLHLSLDHIPSHLLRKKEIWQALVNSMPLEKLLKNLERMGSLGFLSPHSPVSAFVIDALRNTKSIQEAHLHPAHVYVALKQYETSARFMAAAEALNRTKAANSEALLGKFIKPPPRPNPRVLMALHQLFTTTCKLSLVPTGLRYLLYIKMRKFNSFRTIRNCYRCPELTTWQAAALTAVCMLQTDENVTVLAPGVNRDTTVVLDITRDSTVKNVETRLAEHFLHVPADETSCQEDAINWALTNKKEFDVIVCITDVGRKMEAAGEKIAATLNKYRKEMNLPKAKLIMISLIFPIEPGCATSADDPGIFDIAGFDGNVPRLIEAFSRGAF